MVIARILNSDGSDTWDARKQFQRIPEGAPKGTVSLGKGWYLVPNDNHSEDPRDCGRWSSHPSVFYLENG